MSFYLGADVISVKSFFIGLMTLNIQNIPADPVLIISFNNGCIINDYFSL
jgi:hypothetical protein